MVIPTATAWPSDFVTPCLALSARECSFSVGISGGFGRAELREERHRRPWVRDYGVREFCDRRSNGSNRCEKGTLLGETERAGFSAQILID